MIPFGNYPVENPVRPLYDSPFPVPWVDVRNGVLRHSPVCEFDACVCHLDDALLDATRLAMEEGA